MYRLFGSNEQLVERFWNVRKAFMGSGANATFNLYEKTGHSFTTQMQSDVAAFFKDAGLPS